VSGVFHSIVELAGIPGPLVVAAGVFDGVHRGHQELLRRAMDDARAVGGSAVALTFDPHPIRVLRPEIAPRLLTATGHKIRLLRGFGVAHVLVLPFTREFAAQEPDVFIRSLHAASRPLHRICVGHQWSFGKDRRGNVDMLRQLGDELGFSVASIPPVMVDGEAVSSTRIRRAVENGDLETARACLGRDYTIRGTVQAGAQLGRTIGFPTANLAAHSEQFPPNGVYAVFAEIEGTEHPAVANIGVRPTVDSEGKRLLEVHVLGFHQDVYEKEIEIRFKSFLRPEQKFAGLPELQSQIARDVEAAAAILSDP